MANRTVLVVDDDPVARRLVRASLHHDGFRIIETEDAETAARMLESERPDLLILDIELPGMSGFELLTRMSSQISLPVLVLSARVSESDRVLGLDLGAADYVVKPFMPRELAARVRALVRRSGEAVEDARDFGDLVIRVAEREVELRGELVQLTTREFDLLAYLTGRPRRVVSRKELLEQVWKSREDWQDPATVTEHVRRIRRKIEVDPDDPRWVVTARGVGYRFMPPA
jgi:DNA-binding response OmpR family regulator